MAQLYYSPVTVNPGQVPSAQTDFPMLISLTDIRFKSVVNGGYVNNANGYDIRPYSNSTLSTALTYELERYDSGTGEVIMWVKIPTLIDGYVVYLGYGDTSLTTDGSSTATWSNNFKAVYHLGNGATLSLTDNTGGGNTLTNTNIVSAVAGQVDGAAGFVSSSSQSLSNTGATNDPGTTFTVSAWVKATSFPNAYNTVVNLSTVGGYKVIFVKSNAKIAIYVKGVPDNAYDGTGAYTLSAGTWYYLAYVWDITNGLKGYVNAILDGTGGNAGTSPAQQISIGVDLVNPGRFWNGVIDEVRTSTVVRSLNWIITEYNNQAFPNTFETLGSQVWITTPSLAEVQYAFVR